MTIDSSRTSRDYVNIYIRTVLTAILAILCLPYIYSYIMNSYHQEGGDMESFFCSVVMETVYSINCLFANGRVVVGVGW